MAKQPTVTTKALPVFDYPAATALAETSYYVTDLSDVADCYRAIGDFIRDAAQVHHQTSITLRASNGEIDKQSPEWIEIRDALRDVGYTVRTNNRTDTAEIFWG